MVDQEPSPLYADHIIHVQHAWDTAVGYTTRYLCKVYVYSCRKCDLFMFVEAGRTVCSLPCYPHARMIEHPGKWSTNSVFEDPPND